MKLFEIRKKDKLKKFYEYSIKLKFASRKEWENVITTTKYYNIYTETIFISNIKIVTLRKVRTDLKDKEYHIDFLKARDREKIINEIIRKL